MQKHLYILIPIVKWVANVMAIIVLFQYIVPDISSWIDLSVGWVVSGLLAMLFSYWAFHKNLPTDKELAAFIAAWVVITFILDSILGFLTFPTVALMVWRYEYFTQVIFEILGILLMARVMRRHKAYNEAAEGIALE